MKIDDFGVTYFTIIFTLDRLFPLKLCNHPFQFCNLHYFFTTKTQTNYIKKYNKYEHVLS